MAYDLTKEEDVKEYIHNIGIEYRYGCYSEKQPEICHLLGMYIHTFQGNLEQAKKVFKVNCDTYGWGHSCYQYASLNDREKKEELRDEVIQYYIRGCDSGVAKSCYLAGAKLGAKAERSKELPNLVETYHKALNLMEKACNDRLGEACFNLSSIYHNGILKAGVKRDLQKFLQYSIKGCENNNLNCCVNASLMYAKGEGVEKNEELSKKYNEKAKEVYEQMKRGIQFEEGLS